MAGQVIDTEVAQEFMGEVLERVPAQELSSIVAACDAKSAGFRSLLADGRSATLSGADLRRVLRSTFGTRRRADGLLATVGETELIAAIHQLLHGDDALPDRFRAFDEVVADHAEHTFDLPAELLHFTYPDEYWPWTRWMWDPRIETGSLRLVTMDEFDLGGIDRGDTYLRVGQGVAFVRETGSAAGFAAIGEGPFGIDVFLGCVYGIYAYTVLRMRMTQEFNKVVPELPELVRRLLGVLRPEV